MADECRTEVRLEVDEESGGIEPCFRHMQAVPAAEAALLLPVESSCSATATDIQPASRELSLLLLLSPFPTFLAPSFTLHLLISHSL